jgi:hypothetical protein
VDVEAGKQTVTYQAEPIAQCWDEALPLMRDNYEETGFFLGEFKPDFDKFKRMEDAGFVRIFTARNLGKLIGYQVFFVMFGLNCPKALMATCHVAYVVPFHRGRVGIRFLHWVDQQLMIEGATSITRQSTVHRDLSRLYGRMHYHKVEESWTRMNPFCIGLMHGGLSDGY